MDWSYTFISCLDSHSDGTYLIAEEPLVSKGCNAKFLQICSDEETNGWTIPLST